VRTAMWKQGPWEPANSARLTVAMRLLPILYFMIYLNMTVWLFAHGPWQWPVQNGWKLYGFLALAHLALLAGYLSAAFKRPRAYSGPWKLKRVVVASLVTTLVLFLPTLAFRSGSLNLDLLDTLRNLGERYEDTNAMRATNVPHVEYMRMPFAPLLVLMFPAVVVFWSRFSSTLKVVACVAIACNAILWIAIGTNKGLADMVLLCPVLLMASYVAGYFRPKFRGVVAAIACCVLALAAFAWFFAAGQISRARSAEGPRYFAAVDLLASEDHFLLRPLPDFGQGIVLGLSSYVGQGYYALSLALDKPFVPTWGVGNSFTTIRQAERVLGAGEVAKRTYPYRIEEDGWDAEGLWSSIYPWIASDVSFLGTLIVVVLIGRLFALVWLDTSRGDNPFALALFAQLVIMLYYVPANNQVLQGPESLIAFYGTLLLWLRTRTKLTLASETT
jgi:hypothetical protein